MRRSKAPSYSMKTKFKQPFSNRTQQEPSEMNIKENITLNRENPLSNDSPETISENGSKLNSDLRYFSVVYGKRSTKKHKTWEGDGTLEVGLKSATLKDENGKLIGQITNIKTSELNEGSRLCIGSKELEIIEQKICEEIQKRPLEPDDDKPHISKKPRTSKLPSPIVTSLYQSSISNNKKSVLHSKYDELILPKPTDEHQWLHNPECVPVTPVSVPAHLCRILRPHQREGIVFMYKCISGIRNVNYTGAILADEMGLGKTLQCISLIWTLLNAGPYGGIPFLKRVLIVVPSSLTQNWYNEFIRWIGSHKIKIFVVNKKNRPSDYKNCDQTPIYIISYEMFMRSYDDIKNINFDLIICDEGHRLKNCSIKTTAALNSLPCKKRILLTGTPIQNDLQEFYALVDLVNHGILGSQQEFRRKYVDPIVASKQPNAVDEIISIGEMRSEELNRLTSTFILRRTQSVIDKFLPPKNEFVVFCEPTVIQKQIYSTVTNYWIEKYEEKVLKNEQSEHLSIIHALKKICNHPLLINSSVEEKDFHNENLSLRLNRVINETCFSPNVSDDSGKLKVVSLMLKTFKIIKERVVLISNFTQTLDLFEEICKDFKYLRFDGSTPNSTRSDIVTRFNAPNSDVDILLLSSKAGGVGLNLIGGSRLILYDSDWNPATDLQAMARIWREGQKRPVYIYRLLTSGTIEEKIFQRQLSKAGLCESIVDTSAMSNVKLSLEELKDLFSCIGEDKCITHTSLKCNCDGNGIIPIGYAPQTIENREAELLPENSSSLPSLRINQLFQWEHHSKPISPHVLNDMGLAEASEVINYIFKNKTQ